MRIDLLRALAVIVVLAGCREPSSSSTQIPQGRLVRGEGRAARSVVALVPPECRAGEVFGKQPGGEATLGIIGTGLTRGDTVRWNGRPLKTAYGSSRNLSASVPAAWLQTPGPVEVTIEDAGDRSHPKLRAEFLVRASP